MLLDVWYQTVDFLREIMLCRYEPLFNYFMEFSDTAFRVVADDYVTDDSGTGIVHCAPAFGEEDYRVCIGNQILSKVVVICRTDGFNYVAVNIPYYQFA